MNSSELPGNVSWPKPPDKPASAEADFAKAYYQAQIDEVKARYQAEIDRTKAQWEDEIASGAERRKLAEARRDAASAIEDKLLEAVHTSYLEVAKGTLDRSLQRANFVTAVSGAVGTSYAGLLALAYSASAATPRPLPPQGIVPAIFLGLSLLLSAFYVAYVRAGTETRQLIPTGIGGQIQERRMLEFMDYVTDSVVRRAWALRMAIVSLGVGIILIPLPFLETSSRLISILIGAVVLVLVVAIVAELVNIPQQSGSS